MSDSERRIADNEERVSKHDAFPGRFPTDLGNTQEKRARRRAANLGLSLHNLSQISNLYIPLSANHLTNNSFATIDLNVRSCFFFEEATMKSSPLVSCVAQADG